MAHQPAAWGAGALLVGLGFALAALAPAGRATAAVDAPRLTAPPPGATLPGLGLDLQWELPAGTTQLSLQVVPALNDGPGIDLAMNATTRYTLPAPAMGSGPYVVLPGMSYQWRVRAADAPVALGAQDPAWGPWSEWRTFRTPQPSSAGIAPVQPAAGARLRGGAPAVLQWSDSASDIFYYEVQLSTDPAFGEGGPVAAVYHNLIHGGVATPLNSWPTPPLAPNATYHWRVRPRVQGDGVPVPWSATFQFSTDDGGFKNTNRIVFASDRHGGGRNLNLYSMAANGTDVVRLTSGPQSDTSPVWSPDGTRIAFSSNRADGNWDIYTMRPDGSDVRRLTTDAAIDRDPSWSPDGTRIAFISLRGGGESVWVMNADGSGQTRLTSPSNADGRPTWSPDGQRIAFSSRRGTGSPADIYVINLDGTGERNLTEHPQADLYPAWSPNGEWIAFSSFRDGTWEVYVMRSNGFNPLRVTSAGDNLYPAWSPDSAKLLFASGRLGNGNWEVYVLDLASGALTRLTDHPGVDTAPAWSPR